MNLRDLEKEIAGHLQEGNGRVLLLEGRTDVEMLFSLLGAPQPRNGIWAGVIKVVGLKDGGSGGSAVRQRLDAARQLGLRHVYGVLDGDGRDLAALREEFDGPGPLFSWPAYCIENLLVMSSWPVGSGERPSPAAMLVPYAPYVALNRLVALVGDRLASLQLRRFFTPPSTSPLLTTGEVLARLEQDRELLGGLDVAREFEREVCEFLELIGRDPAAAHCRINGKWLVGHYAPGRTRRTPEECRERWRDVVRSAGGVPEVRAWWEKITGRRSGVGR